MRDRRQLLRGGAGLVALGLAGCVEQDQPGGPDPGDEDQPNGSAGDADGNETDDGPGAMDGQDDGTANESDDPPLTGEPDFAVASVDVPDDPPQGEPIDFRVTVVNQGNADGSLQSPVSARLTGGEWSRVGEMDLGVQAGGEGIYRGSVTADYLGQYQLRFDALNETVDFRTVPPELRFGETFRTPNGVGITVEDVMFRKSIPVYDDDGEPSLQYARSNREYAFVSVTVENDSAYVRTAPDPRSFILVVGDEQFKVESLDTELRSLVVGPNERVSEYDPGDSIFRGVRKRGVIPYDVPESLGSSDAMTVAWNGAQNGRRISANWTKD